MPVEPPPGSSEGDGPAVARRIDVRGVVQGVGFRPFVFNLAQACGVLGWVRNTSAGVEIVAEGGRDAVERFVAGLREQAPPRSLITAFEAHRVPPEGFDDFTILESAADPAAYQLVSPDIATCAECRREVLDPSDRRHGYPFTNCTNCGPRFTIIEDLPYDRARTTMRGFAMCPECLREYGDPGDRRFHAEPNACPVCGPQLWLVEGRPDDAQPASRDARAVARRDAALARAAELLRSGAIVAVKGLGGFHLACDATDDAAVHLLKQRKGRPHKPLAVMFPDLEALRGHCRVSQAEEALLVSVEQPIVLLEWRSSSGGSASLISPEVAVRQRYLGAMLPYTPLHMLLLRAAGRPLVMTSGNLAEEPIVKGWEEAGRLAHIADAYLLHDREIAARYDDSVACVRRGRPRLLRRSRGYAPFPVALPRELPQVLACGAELKNTFCMTRDANAFLSQHIGDLENLETLEHFESSIDLYRALFRLEPDVVAYDLHPEYLATKYALELPQERKVGVQHHHAHIAACMAEHGHEERVIGVSLDGLGYGTDGALWGGEVLVCDLLGFARVAHLEYLPLAGGAAAIRRPARTAAGWLLALLGDEALERARRLGLAIDDDEAGIIASQIGAGVNAPLTSSCGRLFDAVSALAGVRDAITYEAQAAIELEMLSTPGAPPYPYGIDGGVAGGREAAVVRLAPLFAGVLDDLEGGAGAARVGSRLHTTVAAFVVDLCARIAEGGGPHTVALSGGVFQNRLLSDLCEDALESTGFTVLAHATTPANDGGLSLGQAVVAGYTELRRRGQLD